jgi:hypothetical protein
LYRRIQHGLELPELGDIQAALFKWSPRSTEAACWSGTDAKVDAGPLFKVRLPVFKGRGGLAKGVNPLSNKALLKALDDDA